MKSTHPMAITLAAFLVSHGSVRASETDDRIESSFIKTYAYQTYLHEDNVMARSKDGNVILTGKVSRESHKDLAEETLESLPGVKKVDNRITVKGERPAKNSDTWIQMKVETVLLFHRNVSSTKTKVAVKNGIVTLKGEALNQAQMDLTAEYAKDVEGVKDVKNNMKIAVVKAKSDETVGENIDDASITAEVKMSLLAHRSTSTLDTHVSTKDGVVTLTGKAKNAAEKDLVTKLASDIHGVKSVENNMIVSAAVSSN